MARIPLRSSRRLRSYLAIGIGTAVWIVSGVSGCEASPGRDLPAFTEQGQLSPGAATDTCSALEAVSPADKGGRAVVGLLIPAGETWAVDTPSTVIEIPSRAFDCTLR